MSKQREATGVNREMQRLRSRRVQPGSAQPHRLWFDIWCESQWNVRRVMTGMVIGRLWLTSDLAVPKGHSSLNRLEANMLSDHALGRWPEPNKHTGEPPSAFQADRENGVSAKTLSYAVWLLCGTDPGGFTVARDNSETVQPWFHTEVNKCRCLTQVWCRLTRFSAWATSVASSLDQLYLTSCIRFMQWVKTPSLPEICILYCSYTW